MKKIALGLMLFLISFTKSFAYPMPNPFPPFHIAGNLYYVGTDDLATYLIVTPEGNILINSDLDANVPMIKASIEKLGFKFSDTKILLISHGHIDHAGGSAEIKKETGAVYEVMDKDVSVVESGGRNDFNYAGDPTFYFTPTKVDKVLHDGDTIKLGNTVLTAHLTAGHTPGCTTWTMPVWENGKKYNVVILGSVNVNTGYQLINNPKYPTIAKDYESSFKTLKSLPCDFFLGAHAIYFDLKKKYDLLGKSKQNPFIDPKGYKQFIDDNEKTFEAKLKEQEAGKAT